MVIYYNDLFYTAILSLPIAYLFSKKTKCTQGNLESDKNLRVCISLIKVDKIKVYFFYVKIY